MRLGPRSGVGPVFISCHRCPELTKKPERLHSYVSPAVCGSHPDFHRTVTPGMGRKGRKGGAKAYMWAAGVGGRCRRSHLRAQDLRRLLTSSAKARSRRFSEVLAKVEPILRVSSLTFQRRERASPTSLGGLGAEGSALLPTGRASGTSGKPALRLELLPAPPGGMELDLRGPRRSGEGFEKSENVKVSRPWLKLSSKLQSESKT